MIYWDETYNPDDGHEVTEGTLQNMSRDDGAKDKEQDDYPDILEDPEEYRKFVDAVTPCKGTDHPCNPWR